MAAHHRTNPSPADPDDSTEPTSREWKDWPCCPDCGRRRRVECPICGVSGTHVPLADTWDDEPLLATRTRVAERDRQARGTTAGVLLLCECCDEPYPPRYFRYCEWCGHDFGGGLERAGDPQPLNARVIWTAAVLVGILTTLFAWFGYVLNR